MIGLINSRVLFFFLASISETNMVNGTKLLNVTGISRGKRDGILKNEKKRKVVKHGTMHLKGVWSVSWLALALAILFYLFPFLFGF